MKQIFAAFAFVLFTTYLFSQQVEQITFPHEGKALYGTIMLPSNVINPPIVIINPGSGANDRDCTLPMVGGNAACLYPGLLNDTLRTYRDLSMALVDSGFAVLRYDKIEYTYGSNLGTITFEKLWLPVESAIDYVKTRTDVDTTKIILIGHSEGSSLIPYIANRKSNIIALISVAGNRTPFDSLLANQILDITQTCGGNMSQAQSQANQILDYYNTIRTNTWNGGTPSLFGVPASVWYDYIRITDSTSLNYAKASLPTLFLGLENDINVPHTELNRFKNEGVVTGDLWEIPDAIHYMCTPNNPLISETLTDTIVYWLRKKLFNSVNELPKHELAYRLCSPFASEQVEICADKEIKYAAVDVFSIDGRKVSTAIFKEQDKVTINTSSFSKGIYLIVVSENNNRKTIKWIKQ